MYGTAYRTRRLYQRIEDCRAFVDGRTGAVAGTPVEPVVIDDLTKLPAYENRLVTLRNVEFALPYGTLVNINEGVSYLGIKQGAAYQASADYNDLTIEYGHYLRDAKGNTAKLYTTWSFTERALSMIPEGAGDITGIVNKRYKCDVYDGRDQMRRPVESWCVRIRRESDITNFKAPAASRLSKTVMQIGPWTDNAGAMQSVTASVGQGQLKHSVGEDVLGSTSGNTQQMYLAWAHARCTAATWDAVKNAWLPAYGNTKGAVCRRDGAGVVEKYRCGQYRYGRLLLDSLEPLDERLYGADFTPVYGLEQHRRPDVLPDGVGRYGQCQNLDADRQRIRGFELAQQHRSARIPLRAARRAERPRKFLDPSAGYPPAQCQRHGEHRFGNQPHRCRTHVVPRFINR